MGGDTSQFFSNQMPATHRAIPPRVPAVSGGTSSGAASSTPSFVTTKLSVPPYRPPKTAPAQAHALPKTMKFAACMGLSWLRSSPTLPSLRRLRTTSASQVAMTAMTHSDSGTTMLSDSSRL